MFGRKRYGIKRTWVDGITQTTIEVPGCPVPWVISMIPAEVARALGWDEPEDDPEPEGLRSFDFDPDDVYLN